MSNHESSAKIWESVYSTAVVGKPNRAVLAAVTTYTEHGANVLEVGPGSGVNAVELAKFGRRVLVADIAGNPLRATRTLQNQHNVADSLSLVQSDGFNLGLTTDAVDMTYSQGLAEHFGEAEMVALLSEQKRVTKPGGYILVDVPQLISLQHVIKTPLILLNLWEFGWETSYTEDGLSKILTDLDLNVVHSYGWGVLPPIPKLFKPIINHAHKGNSTDYEKQSFFQRLRSFNTTPVYGSIRKLLNCVGIVCRNDK